MDPVEELPDRIARALEALDSRAVRSASRVDVERVAARVSKRLSDGEMPAAPRLLARIWSVPLGLRVAAAVVALATVGVLALRHGTAGSSSGLPRDARLTSAPLTAAGVESLSANEVEAVLRAVDSLSAVNAEFAGTSAVSVEDLSVEELRALLQAMQSTEGEL